MFAAHLDNTHSHKQHFCKPHISDWTARLVGQSDIMRLAFLAVLAKLFKSCIHLVFTLRALLNLQLAFKSHLCLYFLYLSLKFPLLSDLLPGQKGIGSQLLLDQAFRQVPTGPLQPSVICLARLFSELSLNTIAISVLVGGDLFIRFAYRIGEVVAVVALLHNFRRDSSPKTGSSALLYIPAQG